MKTGYWYQLSTLILLSLPIAAFGLACGDADEGSSPNRPNPNEIEPNDAATGTTGEDPLTQSAAEPGRPKPETAERLQGGCFWTDWLAPDHPPLELPTDYAVRRVECDDADCDTQRFYACRR